MIHPRDMAGFGGAVIDKELTEEYSVPKRNHARRLISRRYAILRCGITPYTAIIYWKLLKITRSPYLRSTVSPILRNHLHGPIFWRDKPSGST